MKNIRVCVCLCALFLVCNVWAQDDVMKTSPLSDAEQLADEFTAVVEASQNFDGSDGAALKAFNETQALITQMQQQASADYTSAGKDELLELAKAQSAFSEEFQQSLSDIRGDIDKHLQGAKSVRLIVDEWKQGADANVARFKEKDDANFAEYQTQTKANFAAAEMESAKNKLVIWSTIIALTLGSFFMFYMISPRKRRKKAS